MHNADYALMIIGMLMVFLISSCAPQLPQQEIWESGWHGAMSGSPQTDL